MNVITRADARALGLKRYFPATKCKHGHLAERLVSNGSCLECCALKAKDNYHKNIDVERAKQKVRRDTDPMLAEKKRARARRRDPALAQRDALRQVDAEAREAAGAAGEQKYLSKRICPSGHEPYRFVSDNKCVECNRLMCAKRSQARALQNPALMEYRRMKPIIDQLRAEKMAQARKAAEGWNSAKASRQNAIKNGSLTYQGKRCPRGHDGIRYTSSGNCIECLALFASSSAKKQYDSKYAALNRDRIREVSRAYFERTRDQRAEVARRWAAQNADKVRATKMAYKARRRTTESQGDPTTKILAWEKRVPKVCHWCGANCADKYHVDHYEPLSKGGKHEIRNLVIACPRCNLRKSARDPYKFAASLGRLF